MNIWFIIVPIILVGIGVGLFFILRKKSSSNTPINTNPNFKLSINVGKIEPKV